MINNRYIKINNEEEYNSAIKYLHEQGYTKWSSSKIKSIDYYEIIHEYNTRYNGLPNGLHILFYPRTDDLSYMTNEHNGGYQEFIIPKELSLKDKLIKLFNDPDIIIKTNNENELRRYIKLLETLGNFTWGSGVQYTDKISSAVLDNFHYQGYYTHYPYNGSRAYIGETTKQEKIIEFKELLNHI